MKQSTLISLLTISIALLLTNCETQYPIEKEDVFETAKPSDSLAYYFPSILNDTIQRGRADQQDFKQKWYSSALYSFGEPILYTKTDSQTLYRFLWLRSFDPPVCISVKKVNDDWFLSAKMLDRQPSFYFQLSQDENGIIDTIGKNDRLAFITSRKTFHLSSSQGTKFLSLLSSINFWESSMHDKNSVFAASDGAEWILEGRKNGRYHFLLGQSPDGPFRALGEALIRWSRLPIKEEDIY